MATRPTARPPIAKRRGAPTKAPRRAPPIRRIGLRHGGFGDIYHWLLAISPLALLGLVAASYLLANLLFAVAYLCVGGIANARPGALGDAFFFSVQTMATIGYGNMYPTSFGANLLATAEAVYGLLTVALSTGVMFARFSRPTARVMFSNVAVIAPINGQPTLMFRVANTRRNRIVEAQVTVSLMRDEVTSEGFSLRRFHDLALSRSRTPMFAISWTVMHPVEASSPLHGVDPEAFAAQGLELVCSVTGLDDVSMQTVHARHIYEAEDIHWNRRLVDIFVELPDGNRAVDYERFHEITDVQLAGIEPPA